MLPPPLFLLLCGALLMFLAAAAWRWRRRCTATAASAAPPHAFAEPQPQAPAAPEPVDDAAAAEAIAAIVAATEQVREQEREQVARDSPEVRRLRELLAQFHGEDGPQWSALLAAGDIYRKGAFPRFLPDEELAARIFKVAAMCPDGQVAGLAQVKYIEAPTDAIDDADRAGQPLLRDVGRELCDLAYAAIMRMPAGAFERPRFVSSSQRQQQPQQPAAPRQQRGRYTDMPIGVDTDIFGVIDMDEQAALFGAWRQDLQQLLQTNNDTRVDSQVVHDHGVARVTAHNARKLLEEAGGGDGSGAARPPGDADVAQTMREVRGAITAQRGLSPGARADALKVLDQLTTLPHSQVGLSERQALDVVWRRIKTAADDHELRANLTETLVRQLASGVEHGHVVCSTGKITRIIGALDGTSAAPRDAQASRPLWAVREELGGLAAKTRDAVAQRLGGDDASPEAVAQMKREFEQAVRTEYVEGLGMSAAVMAPMIEEYSAGFE